MKKPFLCALLWACGPSLMAQTTDHIYRSWGWSDDLGSARSAGMAGAFVGLADDSSATFANPSGLVLLPKTELVAGVVSRRSGTLPIGDSTSARTAVGFIGGATPLSRRWAVGGYLREPHDLRISLAAGALPGDTGYLETTVTDAGAAAAWKATDGLYLGARLNITHLRLEGLWSHTDGSGTSRVGMATGETRVAGDAGLLVKATDELNFGASFSQGARWNVERTAQGLGPNDFVRGGYQLSSPSRLAVGLSYRPSRTLTLVGEADYLLYRRLHDTLLVLGPERASDYKLDNGWDLRVGAEVTIPVRQVSIDLRTGIYSQAPNAFQYTAPSPGAEFASFVGVTRRTLGSVGASIWARSVRLDVAGLFGGARTVVLAATALRF